MDISSSSPREIFRRKRLLAKKNGRPRGKKIRITIGEKSRERSLQEEAQRRKETALHPPMNSFFIPPEEKQETGSELQNDMADLEKMGIEFLENDVMPIYEQPPPIILPDARNGARFSHQSPQALRFFFSMEKQRKKKGSEKYRVRCIYGPMGVLNSTGFHPSEDYKVRPFSTRIKDMVTLLTKIVTEKLSSNKNYKGKKLDFNSLEVKIYQGKDIFIDPETQRPFLDGDGNEIRVDCNRKLGRHNDCVFDDKGRQSSGDTARGDHPVVTLSLGATRELSFVHKKKEKGKRWKTIEDCSTTDFRLNSGSLFVLLPAQDEKPQTLYDGGYTLHKTQHKARFKESGLSVALVFRSVRTESYFDPRTHQWKWEEDENGYKQKVEKFLKGNEEKYTKFKKAKKISSKRSAREAPTELEGMTANVNRFLQETKRKRLGEGLKRPRGGGSSHDIVPKHAAKRPRTDCDHASRSRLSRHGAAYSDEEFNKSKCPYSSIEKGSRVSVFWSGDGVYFDGTVVQGNSNTEFFLEYDDGVREWVDLSKEQWHKLEPLDTCIVHPIGTPVKKYFPGHGWYSGRIYRRKANTYKVKYDDGDKEKFKLDSMELHAMVERVKTK